MKLFVAGFVTFIATSIDDTIAYAPLMPTRRAKLLVSSGIVTATLADLGIAIFLSRFVRMLPYPRYIGAVGLFLLGIWIIWGRGLEPEPQVELLTRYPERFETTAVVSGPKLFFLGFTAFFLTGLDDTIAYSFLLVSPNAILGLSAGILTATGMGLLFVFFMSDRLKDIEHSREIGGGALMLLGVLIALGIL
ncbi:MAG: hypothetical protein SXQ77_07105 [Halobacteria archaeon]|nr:hypothetical protein [Halobacteria archaeon]